mmetsp:Transcript_59091/g.129758  ORF Transcript_59091/g.129758 Transcript_59091/m.129758 type:complete len:275 (+) Transcript_59091:256-1080(+)
MFGGEIRRKDQSLGERPSPHPHWNERHGHCDQSSSRTSHGWGVRVRSGDVLIVDSRADVDPIRDHEVSVELKADLQRHGSHGFLPPSHAIRRVRAHDDPIGLDLVGVPNDAVGSGFPLLLRNEGKLHLAVPKLRENILRFSLFKCFEKTLESLSHLEGVVTVLPLHEALDVDSMDLVARLRKSEGVQDGLHGGLVEVRRHNPDCFSPKWHLCDFLVLDADQARAISLGHSDGHVRRNLATEDVVVVLPALQTMEPHDHIIGRQALDGFADLVAG